MRKFLFSISIFITAYVISPKSPAMPAPVLSDVGMQSGFFYSSLAPHGEWIEMESGTMVWRPFRIPHEWRPYLVGRWVWTDDYGWYWMSDEPFGWITYHYGRWYFDDEYGWVWMPDDVWAPAWVEWRYDLDYIGWAPLPPYARFNGRFGIRSTTRWTAPVHYWNVIRYNRFGSVIHYRDTAPEEYARRLLHTGRSGPQFGIDHERIINRGVDRTIIERRGNVRFARTEVRETHDQSGERLTRSNDSQRLEIYRPTRDELHNNTDRIEARRGERNLSIDMKKAGKPRAESRTPHVEERQVQRDRDELRRELIQRHGRQQNPSPPSVREDHRQPGRERRIENSRTAQPGRPAQGGRSGNKSER